MADTVIDLLRAHFRQLRLPTMSHEFKKLAPDTTANNQNFSSSGLASPRPSRP